MKSPIVAVNVIPGFAPDLRISAAVRARADWEEAEVVRMLSCWVSELEPELIFHAGHLVGLTIAGLPIGIIAPVVVRARPYPSFAGARHV